MDNFEEIITIPYVKMRLNQGYVMRIPAQFSPNGKEAVIKLESQN